MIKTPTIKIEKGIKVPDTYHERSKWPFGKMNVGDSFWVPSEDFRVRQAASYWGARHGTKFSVRQENSGWRCWRIK